MSGPYNEAATTVGLLGPPAYATSMVELDLNEGVAKEFPGPYI